MKTRFLLGENSLIDIYTYFQLWNSTCKVNRTSQNLTKRTDLRMSIKLCVNSVNTICSSKCYGAVRGNLNTILTLI